MYDEFLEEGIRELPENERRDFIQLLRAYDATGDAVQCKECGNPHYLIPVFKDRNPQNIVRSNTYFLCVRCVAKLNLQEALKDFMFRGFE